MKKILVADIGGTHSRFARFDAEKGESLRLRDTAWLKTAQADSFSGLIEELRQEAPELDPGRFHAMVLAVAGPVQDEVYSDPPNIPWDIDVSHPGRLGLPRCVMMNDFEAQAWGCRSDAASSAVPLQPGEIDKSSALAVIGAGTGLGHCALTPDPRGGYLAVPSEGGHQSLSATDEEEFRLLEFVRQRRGEAYARTESVVSGSGLELIHEFLTGKALKAPEVAAGLSLKSPTAAMFARFYGRCARNYGLAVLAKGGVYVTGGVAAKSPILVNHPAFMEEFRSSPTHSRLLATIPVLFNANQELGLFGAALRGYHEVRS